MKSIEKGINKKVNILTKKVFNEITKRIVIKKMGM